MYKRTKNYLKTFSLITLTIMFVGLDTLPMSKEIKHSDNIKYYSYTKPINIIREVKDLPKEHIVITPVKKLEGQALINKYIVDICNIYNNKIKPELIMSIVQQESEYKETAKNGSCVGLMQMSTRWHVDRASKLGVVNFYDPYSNILLGVDYLTELIDKYKDITLVLMLYNMNHNDAIRLYHEGKITNYARTIIKRAEDLKKG